MSSKKLDESWKGWIRENLQRQCSPEELLGILLKNAFSVDSIRESMGDRFPIHSDLLGAMKVSVDYGALASVRLTLPGNTPKVRKIETDLLQIYEIEEFMTDQECTDIVAVINQHLRPSGVTYASEDKFYRTSSTCDLALIESDIVKNLDQKIAETLGVRLPYSEGIQAQRYNVGQEFKAHNDFFEPGTEQYDKFGGDRGNRTWTFMVYLNDVAAGGGTHFVSLGKTFPPKIGRAIIWNNLNRDGTVNRDSMHAGLPVEVGHKIIITKWFREKGGGPMFFN